jgi:hypothetical protein
MFKSFLILIVFFNFSITNVSANENKTDSGGAENIGLILLATGKLTGACGIMKLQLEFQENTKLDNGYKFIARFWTAEAARLGKTLEKYAADCAVTVNNYDDFYTRLEAQ